MPGILDSLKEIIFGKSEPTQLVQVTAPRPAGMLGWPKDEIIKKVLLGAPGKPPTGVNTQNTYGFDGVEVKSLNPIESLLRGGARSAMSDSALSTRAEAVWRALQHDYPDLSRQVGGISIDPSLYPRPGDNYEILGQALDDGRNVISLSPRTFEPGYDPRDTMVHEMTHLGQFANSNPAFEQMYNTGPYADRVSEQQARRVSGADQLLKKR